VATAEKAVETEIMNGSTSLCSRGAGEAAVST
jgi:hypothetical protein